MASLAAAPAAGTNLSQRRATPFPKAIAANEAPGGAGRIALRRRPGAIARATRSTVSSAIA